MSEESSESSSLSEDHDHEHHSGHDAELEMVISRGLMIMSGLYVFYLLETLLGLCSSRKTEEPTGDQEWIFFRIL